MSGDCCAERPAEGPAGKPSCPGCGHRGQSVERGTVAALVLGPVPVRQSFWLCRNRECEVAYFGDAGARLRVSELRFLPALKSESPEALVCYCFLHRRSEIASELRSSGVCALVERIAAKVSSRECACEVRHPSGQCCLGEINAEIHRLRERLTGSSLESPP